MDYFGRAGRIAPALRHCMALVGMGLCVDAVPIQAFAIEAQIAIRAALFLCGAAVLLAPHQWTNTSGTSWRDHLDHGLLSISLCVSVASVAQLGSLPASTLARVVLAAGVEEIVFRSSLPNKLASIRRELAPTFTTLALSQMTFALCHVAIAGGVASPNAIRTGGRLFAAGFFLASLKARGGLPLAIAVHTLGNAALLTTHPVGTTSSRVLALFVLLSALHWLSSRAVERMGLRRRHASADPIASAPMTGDVLSSRRYWGGDADG